MYDKNFHVCLNYSKVLLMIKTIFILNIFFQIYIFSKYKEKSNSDKSLIELEKNDTKIIEKEEFQEYFNLSQYNMTKFLVYDHFYFNSMSMFHHFKDKYFNISSFDYIFSKEYKKIRIQFIFGIYDKNKELIQPSDFALYDGLTTLCYMSINKNIIYSLPKIVDNKYFECIEFFYIDESPHFGMHFYPHRAKSYLTLSFNLYKFINLNDITHQNDTIFSPEFVSNEYNKLVKNTMDKELYRNHILTRNYMKSPFCNLKRNVVEERKGWVFKNLYNNYFCYCIGKKCVRREVKQMCKLNFYKYIIDMNRYLYPKTEYVFVDFIFKDLPSDDTFPVFEEMIKQNISAHYITEKKELFNQYCHNNKRCQTIIPINLYSYYKFGDFVEKYLTLILKLKSVISGKGSSFHYLSYLFYKIEYITYIAVGHGVDYFKDYLFGRYRIYGSKINNKILIPPAQVLIDCALNYGWDNNKIIKINLPRWDRYSNIDYYFSGNITSNSILIMFTWRYTKWWDGLREISNIYHENTIKLLRDKKLGEALNKKNMTLYFSLHRFVNKKYINKYNETIKEFDYLKFVKQNEISECLAKTNLVVSDFSSIIFDIMSRRKPFVIYIPDAEDKTIRKYYTNDYIELIENMKNDKIKFKNKCNTIEETVNKIISYINNDFKIESDLQEFYDNFNFKTNNNSNEFIEYLINME